MEAVWTSAFFSVMLAILGLIWRDLSQKLNGKTSRELCDERSKNLLSQLEWQRGILIRNEQRLIRIEKRLAYLNGEKENENNN